LYEPLPKRTAAPEAFAVTAVNLLSAALKLAPRSDAFWILLSFFTVYTYSSAVKPEPAKSLPALGAASTNLMLAPEVAKPLF